MANGTNGCKGIRQLDPVQGLVSYVEDIKPFHSKVIEVLIEYVSQEFVNITISDRLEWEVDIVSGSINQVGMLECEPGYATESYGGPAAHPITTPNQGANIIDGYTFGFRSDSFAVPGDQTDSFRSGQPVFIEAFVEDHSNLHDILEVNTGPAGSGSFIIPGDQTSNPGFDVGDDFFVLDAPRSKLFTVAVGGPSYDAVEDETTIPVEQVVTNADVGQQLGLTRVLDTDNSGTFTISNVVFDGGSIDSWPDITDPSTYTLGNDPHTDVFVDHTFTAPSPDLLVPERYVASARIDFLDLKEVFGVDPEEGALRREIVGISTADNEFVVLGDLQENNLLDGDEVVITQSTGNNGTYTIDSISYDSGDDETTIGTVESIDDSTVDGIADFYIPSNAFVVDGDHRFRFNLGTTFDLVGGNLTGTYTTLDSNLFDGQTVIRAFEPIFERGEGLVITGTMPNNKFIVDGDVTGLFPSGTLFTVVGSDGNDGSYVVDGAPSFSSGETSIPIGTDLSFVQTTSGEIFRVEPGIIKEHLYGYGESSKICGTIPEGNAVATIIETLEIVISGDTLVGSWDTNAWDVGPFNE